MAKVRRVILLGATEEENRDLVEEIEEKWKYDKSVIKAVKVNKAADADTVNGKTVAVDVPSWAEFTDTIYTHPNHSGDVTSSGDGATTIGDNKVLTKHILNANVTNAKLANMAAKTLKGRKETSAGVPQDLTAAEVRTLLNVADGANNYSHPTGAGSNHIPTGGNAGQILVNTASGTVQWANMPEGVKIAVGATEPPGLVEGDWWYKEVI
mgnify:CR=1 FL=1